MVIVLSNLTKPGTMYDSSKLAILGRNINEDVQKRTNKMYIVKTSINGLTAKFTVKKWNIETQSYGNTSSNEQEILAGKISTFLNNNGISHTIKVI